VRVSGLIQRPSPHAHCKPRADSKGAATGDELAVAVRSREWLGLLYGARLCSVDTEEDSESRTRLTRAEMLEGADTIRRLLDLSGRVKLPGDDLETSDNQ
jgi:hypothetical protein